MKNTQVEEIAIDEPIVAVGKTFIGDYAKSQQYITEVQAILGDSTISIVPNKVLGVYYDNPQEKPAEELKSFQGVLLNDGVEDNLDPSLEKLTLEGKWLHISVSGDPMKSIYAGYNALFNHIQEKKLVLKSNAGYQISTFENNEMITDIYMEISE